MKFSRTIPRTNKYYKDAIYEDEGHLPHPRMDDTWVVSTKQSTRRKVVYSVIKNAVQYTDFQIHF